MKFKNYKSWLSFFAFLSAYVYAVYTHQEEPIVYTTGLFLVVMSFALMLRSQDLLSLMKIVIVRFKK